MKQLGIWPDFDRGDSFGKRYVKVNQVLLRLRDALETDLWTLDALWWFMDQGASGLAAGEGDETSTLTTEVGATLARINQQFGLERHLH
jgi:hypothetical protein